MLPDSVVTWQVAPAADAYCTDQPVEVDRRRGGVAQLDEIVGERGAGVAAAAVHLADRDVGRRGRGGRPGDGEDADREQDRCGDRDDARRDWTHRPLLAGTGRRRHEPAVKRRCRTPPGRSPRVASAHGLAARGPARRGTGSSGSPTPTGSTSPARGRDQARSRQLLHRRRRGHRAGPVGAAVHAAPVPGRASTARRSTRSGCRRARRTGCRPCEVAFPVRADRRRAVRHRAGQRGLGRADVHRGVPPVALAPGRHRAAGRAAHRPRPAAGHRLREAKVVARGRRRCSTSWARSAGRRPRGNRGMHIYVRIGPRARVHRGPPGRAGVRPRGRAADPDARHHRVVEGGARRAASSSTTTRTPATARSPRAYSVRGEPGARVSTPLTGTRCRTRTRASSPSRTVPERFAELGDVHAGIDDHPFGRSSRCWSGPTGTSATAASATRPTRQTSRRWRASRCACSPVARAGGTKPAGW